MTFPRPSGDPPTTTAQYRATLRHRRVDLVAQHIVRLSVLKQVHTWTQSSVASRTVKTTADEDQSTCGAKSSSVKGVPDEGDGVLERRGDRCIGRAASRVDQTVDDSSTPQASE